MSGRHALPRLLAAASSLLVVALFIGFTGDVVRLWPLFGIPVFITALAYHAPGAIVMGALSSATLALFISERGLPSDEHGSQIVLGMCVYVIAATVVGLRLRRLYTERGVLEQSSMRDPLTGLYSSTYLKSRLDEEVRRASRYETPLSFVVMDLDGFKAFNETFGTHRGDLLLGHLAEIVRIAIRSTDIAARLDGGTFAFVLPITELEGAARMAERVRALVQDTDFEGDELEPITKHTVSLGVASFPEYAGDAEGLMAMAAENLRRAKEGGRNRVANAAPSESVPRENATSARGDVVS